MLGIKGNPSISPDTISGSPSALDPRLLLSSPPLKMDASRADLMRYLPNPQTLLAETSPAVLPPSAIPAPWFFRCDTTSTASCRPQQPLYFFIFPSTGSTLQAQLAFIFVDGTKLISHHASRQKRRWQWLVNAIICKTLKSQVFSKNPHALNLQFLTSVK